MLDEKRIKEAEKNVRSYVSEGLLQKKDPDKNILDILISNGKESLRVADACKDQELSALWMIVCSYYSMFYYANAILLSFGYKVGEKIVHKVTSDSLIVYVRGKLKDALIMDFEEAKEEALDLAGMKADSLIENFEFEKKKRGRIQYQTTASGIRAKADTSLKRAKEFTKEMEKLLLEK